MHQACGVDATKSSTSPSRWAQGQRRRQRVGKSRMFNIITTMCKQEQSTVICYIEAMALENIMIAWET